MTHLFETLRIHRYKFHMCMHSREFGVDTFCGVCRRVTTVLHQYYSISSRVHVWLCLHNMCCTCMHEDDARKVRQGIMPKRRRRQHRLTHMDSNHARPPPKTPAHVVSPFRFVDATFTSRQPHRGFCRWFWSRVCLGVCVNGKPHRT